MANIIEEKSFAFAIRIVNLYKHLNEALIYISHGGENEKTFNLFLPDSVKFIGAQAFAGCNNMNGVSFESKDGWQIFDWPSSTSGDPVDVTDSELNASNFKEAYLRKYWKR